MTPQEAALRGALGGLPPAPTLGDIFGGGPKPVMVSPGSPAPVKPGVDIRAPQQRAILSARTPPPAAARAPAEEAVGEAAAADAAKGAEDQFARLYEQMRAKSQEDLKRAKDDARIDPEQEAILRSQESRSDEDYKDIEDQKRRRDWGALVDMGVAMASSNSPYFSAALAAGLQAGNRGLDEAVSERARQRALVKDRESQIAQARYNALQAARKEAREDLVAGEDLTATRVKTAALTNEAIENLANQPARSAKIIADAETARAKAIFAVQGEQADIDYKLAAAEAQRAAAAENRAGAEAYRTGQRGGRGGGRGLDGDRYDREEIDAAENDFQEAAAEADAAAKLWKMSNTTDYAGSKGVGELFVEMNAARRKALLAANKMRKRKGQPPMTMGQLFRVPGKPSAGARAVGAARPAAPAADPLGIR